MQRDNRKKKSIDRLVRYSPISRNIYIIHVSSAAAKASARYSDSVLDLVTVVCFLEDQEMQFDPRYIQYPVVDRRVSGQPTQSTSKNPYKLREDSDTLRRPYANVPLTYLIILLTAWQCPSLGSDIN